MKWKKVGKNIKKQRKGGRKKNAEDDSVPVADNLTQHL